ncbi:SGNH/GDSL hydrolase family protein [uncultured Thiodictyon sp.]|jgi:phospholipase/lecithinase/hemolysin|uniref:SGNH/GDSL hydrolase family protein n=1 Tax=uncultured Thiodictyon sp. TaxID=1846217 RepID=UPI0025CBBBC0|nr:SGNH/GDSL hydrolase family protein [uncultured Thiodictyon sp.]
MRTLTKFAGTCVLAMSVVTTVNAGAFSQLVVFGDSLSDPGNAAAMTTPIGGGPPVFPPSPPYAYRFSNGPTAAEYLAQSYGVTVNQGWPTANPNSNNFAVGGALNGDGNYNSTVNSPTGLTNYPAVANTGIAKQVARYDNSTLVPDQTLFLLWGGPNDIFLGLAAQPQNMDTVIVQALDAMAYNIQTLVGLGAEHILVPGMPDLSKTPEALEALEAGKVDLWALISKSSADYNLGLTNLLDALDSLLSDTILYRFDTAAFLGQVTANPGAYGFTNTADSCLYSGFWSTDPGCTGYLYFDKVHPTTAAHRLLAAQFAAAAPAPETYALMLLGLAVLGWSMNRSRRRYGQCGQ